MSAPTLLAHRPPAQETDVTASAHRDRFVRDNLPPPEHWPELLFERPELQFPARLNATTRLLDDALTDGSDSAQRTALLGTNTRWSYAELHARVNRIARWLTQSRGLVPGNRVLLAGANSPMLAACWLAVWKAGGVAVGAMPMLRARELSQIVRLGRVSHALCARAMQTELEATRAACSELAHLDFYDDPDLATELDALPAQFEAVATAADDPALIAFTSGTTGVPKGCVHFHRDVIAMCEGFPRHCLHPTRDDVFIGSPPLAFTFGLGGLLCFPLYARACAVLIEKASPELLLPALVQHSATVCFTSPTAYRRMAPLVGAHNLARLSKCVAAGEVLPGATRDLWRNATGLEIYDGIGGTEMIHIYIASNPQNWRMGAIGKPLPGFRAMLVDEDMQPVPIGQEGRLAIKGPVGCRYLADARQRNYVREGWNLTGDAYHMDADGYYYYHARVDDLIVTSGYNVSSPEVEAVLLEHPAVADCGVVGVPDDERGQVLKACVVLKPGITADDALAASLQAFVREHAAPYKYPRLVRFVTELPRTETGKLQRFRLREQT